jgi:hypothetical protein
LALAPLRPSIKANFKGGVDVSANALLAFAIKNRHAIDSAAKNNFKVRGRTINIKNFT